jgi:hypothetical protein
MLTRLKVDGFKNLDGIDVRFGPFTCIAGANGVGKSNLFDTISFLAALADRPLAEAAAAIRGTEGRVGDVRSLFRTTGGRRASTMSFEAELIIPENGTDDLGSPATASMTPADDPLRDLWTSNLLTAKSSPMTDGEIDILVATQAAAKGHNFPRLTLVGVVDADLGLRGGDLRAAERTYQLLAQATGRAGRADKPGRALLQTWTPEHPVLMALAVIRLVFGNRAMFVFSREERALRAAVA